MDTNAADWRWLTSEPDCQLHQKPPLADPPSDLPSGHGLNYDLRHASLAQCRQIFRPHTKARFGRIDLAHNFGNRRPLRTKRTTSSLCIVAANKLRALALRNLSRRDRR